MATVDNIRKKEFLTVLFEMVEKNSVDNNIVKLTKEQKIMLELSDNDIENNRIIPQEQLDKDDLKWLKEL